VTYLDWCWAVFTYAGLTFLAIAAVFATIAAVVIVAGVVLTLIDEFRS